MADSTSTNCLNCFSPLEAELSYCPQCGQKVHKISWSFTALISTFFANLLNIEAKLYLTLRDIWKPAKLTQAFIKGKRKSYYHPMRLLLVSLFSFIAILIYFVDFGSLEEFDKKIKQTRTDLFLVEQLDSLKLMIDSSQHHYLDTIIARQDISIDSTTLMSGLINLDLGKVKTKEILQSTPEEVIKRDKVTHWLSKLWIHQSYKVINDPKGTLVFMLSNMTWAVLLLILFMSLVAKLIYIRSSRYYVEHFLLYSQITSFSSFIGIIILGIRFLTGISFDVASIIWLLTSLVYSLLSIKSYYGDSILKTLVKFSMISFIMIFAAMILLFGIAALAILIF